MSSRLIPAHVLITGDTNSKRPTRVRIWPESASPQAHQLLFGRLKPGVFTSAVELQSAINGFIADANDKPKPFVWTKSADAILAAVHRGRQALEAIH